MNPYQILEVAVDATQDQIKSQYRKLAAILHPDKPGGDITKFQELAKAYDILSNPVSREKYDTTGSTEKDDFGKSFHRFFNEVLMKQLEAMPDIEHADPIREFKRAVKELKNGLLDVKKKHHAKLSKLEKFKRRIIAKKKSNGLLEFSTNAQINHAQILIGQIDLEIKFADDCSEVLEHYDYSFEKIDRGFTTFKIT